MKASQTILRLAATAAATLFLAVAAAGMAPGERTSHAATLRSYLEGHVSGAERRLLDDAKDGRWDGHSLLRAALVAGGVEDPVRLARCEARLDDWSAELKRKETLASPPRRQAQAVFEFMHNRILTGDYELDATGVEAAVEEGRFNCVSATVLFQCLAGRCGLAVCGLEMPGHAKARVFLDGDTLDIETTCPTWFQSEGSGSRVRGSGLSTPSPQLSTLHAPACVRELTPVELVAMIYYNRGVDLLAEGRFAEAAAANAKAILLDLRSETAHGNLLAVLNNWAIELGRLGRYREAADLLAGGMAMEPEFSTFKTNYVYVHHRWVEELCRQRRYETALARLTAAGRAMPGEPYFRQARTEIYARWAESAPPGQGQFDRARIAN